MDKVSVIIPSYNRYTYLQKTLKSVRDQTYTNIEIIVVNDCSTQPEYYTHDWSGIVILHLEENSKAIFGHHSVGYVRNKGIEVATGKYIAFCDDDDIWFPSKLELQINAMKITGCKMSSTDGLVGYGPHDPSKTYKKYNSENCYEPIKKIYTDKNSSFMNDGFPHIWTHEFIKVHNCIICSSVVLEKEVLDRIGNFKYLGHGKEDYDCWLRALETTSLVYVNDICFYYDDGHGDGQAS
jgi:glycosyltransferase involved in cell wall biosynthesis